MALVQYTGKNVFGVFMGAGDIMRLLPGVNEVNEEHLKRAMTMPLFNNRIKRGQVLILKSNIGKDGKTSVDDMLKNIPNIYDLKLLKKIISSDGREVVVKAASDRIQEIKNPQKEKTDGGEHFV